LRKATNERLAIDFTSVKPEKTLFVQKQCKYQPVRAQIPGSGQWDFSKYCSQFV